MSVNMLEIGAMPAYEFTELMDPLPVGFVTRVHQRMDTASNSNVNRDGIVSGGFRNVIQALVLPANSDFEMIQVNSICFIALSEFIKPLFLRVSPCLHSVSRLLSRKESTRLL